MTVWALLHPRMTLEHLGFLPGWLDNNDPRSASEQLDAHYKHGGGWSPFGKDKFKLTKGYRLLYPGDPPQEPLAMTSVRNEVVLVYESDIVAIVQPDDTFEVARLG